MQDKNGKEMKAGMIVRISGAFQVIPTGPARI